MNDFMSEGQAHLWNLALESVHWSLRYAPNNLDNLAARNDVKGERERALSRVTEMCDATKGDDE